MQIKLQQSQSSRNISENMNKVLQVREPVLFFLYNSSKSSVVLTAFSFVVTHHFSIGRVK